MKRKNSMIKNFTLSPHLSSNLFSPYINSLAFSLSIYNRFSGKHFVSTLLLKYVQKSYLHHVIKVPAQIFMITTKHYQKYWKVVNIEEVHGFWFKKKMKTITWKNYMVYRMFSCFLNPITRCVTLWITN